MPLAHAVSLVIIVAASCLLFYQNFSHSGILMHVDMTWPLSLGRINDIYRHTWTQYGSGLTTFNLMTILWEYPLLLLAQLLHLSTATYLLLLFIGTVSLAGISMYVLAFRTITSFDLEGTWKYASFAGALIAGLIYIFNPWSLGHLWPYYMYPAYALLPLIILVMVKAFTAPTYSHIIVLALLIALSTNAPINVVWLWFMVLTYALYYVLIHRFEKERILAALKVVGGSILLYAVLDASWIVPYLGTWLTHTTPMPGYTVDQSMLGGLSMNNTILNNFRLTAGWAYPVNVNPNNTLGVFLSFSLPLLAILGLILLRKELKRNATVVYLTMISLVVIVLATGTSFFIKRIYNFFVLQMPGASSLGWLIRVPDRWLVFVPVLYALVIGALFARLLRRKPELPPDLEEGGGSNL